MNIKIKPIDETRDLKEQIIHQNRLRRSFSQPKAKTNSKIILKHEKISVSNDEYLWVEEQRHVTTEHRAPLEKSKLEKEKIESDKEKILKIITSAPNADRINKESTLKSDIITKEQETQEKGDTEILSEDTTKTSNSDTTSKAVLTTRDITEEVEVSPYETSKHLVKFIVS